MPISESLPQLATHVAPTFLDDPHEAVRAWQAHLDAGRIGRRLTLDPAIAANDARTAALFASLRRPAGGAR